MLSCRIVNGGCHWRFITTGCCGCGIRLLLARLLLRLRQHGTVGLTRASCLIVCHRKRTRNVNHMHHVSSTSACLEVTGPRTSQSTSCDRPFQSRNILYCWRLIGTWLTSFCLDNYGWFGHKPLRYLRFVHRRENHRLPIVICHCSGSGRSLTGEFVDVLNHYPIAGTYDNLIFAFR